MTALAIFIGLIFVAFYIGHVGDDIKESFREYTRNREWFYREQALVLQKKRLQSLRAKYRSSQKPQHQIQSDNGEIKTSLDAESIGWEA